jgi:NAD(P)H-dependent flavin oxidoreductase YrpB (nitropropane dioxygenase family)
MIPQAWHDFVNKVLAENNVPKLPADLEQGRAIAAGLGVDDQSGDAVDVALRHPLAKMLVNALGPVPEHVVKKCHGAGILVGALVGAPRHAQKQVDIGVDVIIAQGTEAGGHCGEIATMVLVPEVVDAVGPAVCVLAAGGIATGRQMTAGIALGAQGAWTGSMWLTVAESDTNPTIIANLLAATSRDTVRSRAMTGKPARLLKSAWTEAWEREDSPGYLPLPLQGLVFGEAARRFTRANNMELSVWPVGQFVGSLNKVRPTQEVMFEMVEEWIATTQRLNTLIQD